MGVARWMAFMGGIVAAIRWLEIGGHGLGSRRLVLALGWDALVLAICRSTAVYFP
ncbi:hypothetical protein TIFTF001_002646 [Ficus carica]|uniref:Uncharacterized protein n=1 Tax=Ficus carica TaxID=3494 RepID=A0AA88CSL1_FICCA|nr:hypothetical protein TIFTF001_002646 [Ficus carica]